MIQMNLGIQSITFLASIILLSKSSHMMIKHSVKISRLTRLGELAIGFIVISMITTIPELMISLMAIRNNDLELSIGSLFGSLITNICLILGIIAIKKPLEIGGDSLKKLL